MTWAVVLVMVVGLIGSLPRFEWRDAEDAMRRFFSPVANAVDPVAAPATAWLDQTARALREKFGAVDDVAAAPEDREPAGSHGSGGVNVRVYRGSERSDGPAPGTYGSGVVEPRVYRGDSGEAKALSGPAAVIDGDTLEVGGVRVRLHGIDAPESAQRCRSGGRFWPCGHEAKRALAGRVGGQRVVCKERDRDDYGRVVAVCSIGGRDLNAWMAAEGWALVNRRFSRAYAAEESRARAAKRGVWRGEVVAPWDWRKGKRLAGAVECDIKGNISGSGKRIYHVRGGQYYARTRIDTSRGERWFCTEDEARAAGWRRSRR